MKTETAPPEKKNKNSQTNKTLKKNVLNVTLLNARNMKTVNSKVNKLAEIQTLTELNECDILCVSETWLDCKITATELLSDNFIIFRKDRTTGQKGRSLLMAVNANIPTNVVGDLYTGGKPTRSSTILFILCYRPPSSSITGFVQDLETILDKSTKLYNKFCLLGDFNLPGIKWGNLPLSSKRDESRFCELVDTCGLKQINKIPSTIHGNILDLVLTNTPYLYSDIV